MLFRNIKYLEKESLKVNFRANIKLILAKQEKPMLNKATTESDSVGRLVPRILGSI